MARKHHGRMRRYLKYRGAHFTPVEAKELSQLRRLDYHEVIIMVKQRKALWNDFTSLAVNRAWGQTRRKREWYGIVKEWYVANDYVEKGFAWWKKFPTQNIWFWFDDVASRLPIEQRYSNLAPSRRKKGKSLKQREADARRAVVNVENQRWIDQKMKTVARSPSRDKELTEQAQRLGFKGKSLYRTALRRGYV